MSLMNFTFGDVVYMNKLSSVPAAHPCDCGRGQLEVFKGKQPLEVEPHSCKEKLRKEQRTRTQDWEGYMRN